MADIKPGRYTVGEILSLADFDYKEKAKVDYNERGWDARLIKVGGLPFAELDDVIEIPPTADEVEITVDSKTEAVLGIELDEEAEKARAYSFEHAAEASDSRKTSKANK